MTPTESLYYAIGELAYAVAKADGRVQHEEKEQFHNLVARELEKDNHGFSVSEIIFHIMNKDKATLPDSYHWAMKEVRRNSHYLSPGIKETFIRVMEKVAAAYPPVTIEEESILERFRKDIAPLKGDPVYYDPRKG
jgi:uncharacterized tellurite resistance protein B-like protein